MDEAILAQLRTAETLLGEEDGLVAHDRTYRVAYWDWRMEAMSGLSADEVLGRDSFEIFPFLIPNGDDALFREALAGRRVCCGPRPFAIAATGRRGMYQACYSPLRDLNGEVVGIAAVVRDVTEGHILAEQLRETENRFRNMADASPVLLWMSGLDARCTFVNQTWVAFTGRSLEEACDSCWTAGVHVADVHRFTDTYERAFAAREPFEMEYRLRRADGEYRYVLNRGVPRFTPEGTFAGYIGSCVDITDHKDVEAQLRQSVRDREDFVAVASHELRTPLTALQLTLEKLLRDVPKAGSGSDGHPFVRHAVRAVGQVHRMAELVQELLDVSRLASGRVELQRAPVDLAAVAAAAVERLTDAARRGGSTLLFERDAPVVGLWDASRLERVVMNLVSNAIKYGAGKPVCVDVRAAADRAILTVRDHGIGIDPEDQSRIFGQFERAVSSRNYSGFGLGLWIVREIVRMHAGSVLVASAAGAGATFTVSLPWSGPSAEGVTR
jgi:PAS domain S-box-containing protein